MVKKLLAVVAVLVLCVSLGACKKKEQPQMPAGHPPMGNMPGQSLPKVERQVVVSKEVQAKWKAVKIEVEDKKAKTKKAYTINIGSDMTIPNTTMKVKVLAFLPDFKMTEKEFYSASDKPNQPAAQVQVTDNGKEIFNNWLFSLQPTIHPFQNDQIGLVLLGGVQK